MRDFLRNLALLVVIGIVLLIAFPDLVRQILGFYNGLGILPIFVLMVIAAALPKRKRNSKN